MVEWVSFTNTISELIAELIIVLVKYRKRKAVVLVTKSDCLPCLQKVQEATFSHN